ATLVEQAAWWADHADTDTILRARLTMLQSMVATSSGDWVSGGALARRSLHDFADQWEADPLGRFGWNMIAREIALTERWDAGCGEARDAVLAVARDPGRGLTLQGTQALGEALAGRPVDGLRV